MSDSRPNIKLSPQTSGDLSLEEIARDAKLEAHDWKTTQFLGGLDLAKLLIKLIGVVLLLIALFAVLTFPGKSAPAAVRESWFSEIKDLIQLLVVSLLVPILATLIGYIFGRNEAQP
jgi:hypothetical protein